VSEKYLGSCAALAKRLGMDKPTCCSSCHSDEEWSEENGGNYYLGELGLDGGYYTCCCTMQEAAKIAATEAKP